MKFPRIIMNILAVIHKFQGGYHTLFEIYIIEIIYTEFGDCSRILVLIARFWCF